MPSDFILAFAAGAISFFAPCVVPLLPAYVGYIGGASLSEINANPAAFQRRLLQGSALYILGFGLVFIALGAAAGILGSGFRGQMGVIQRIGGVLVIVMGASLAGFLPARFSQRSFRLLGDGTARSGSAPFVLGVVFGTAWTPCVGPVLGSILVLAATSGQALSGAALLAVYTLGLGLPFAFASLILASFPSALRPIVRYAAKISRVCGVLLIALGTLLVLGLYTALAGYLSAPFVH